MRRNVHRWLVGLCLVAALAIPGVTLAQDGLPPEGTSNGLHLYTEYPSEVIGLNETATISFVVNGIASPEVVDLSVDGLPDGWTAIFKGGGKTIQSVFVEPDQDENFDLRLTPSSTATSGLMTIDVVAKGDGVEATLPIDLTLQDKAPANLTLNTDLPTLRGKPDTTFRYNLTLKNDGADEMTVNLLADAPQYFNVTFTYSGQDVTSLPVAAGESKNITVEASPLVTTIPADQYPIVVHAQGGDVSADLDLMAEVVGQATVDMSTVDDVLSGRVKADSDTTITLVVRNTGSAPARAIDMSASTPNDWKVTFSPQQIDEIPAGQSVDVTANVTPSQNAIAGDYVLTFRAKPQDGNTKSVDYRITVFTSTLWGVIGIALIAAAVLGVGVAVSQFGRR